MLYLELWHHTLNIRFLSRRCAKTHSENQLTYYSDNNVMKKVLH